MKNGRTDEEFLDYADGDADFAAYLKKVDRICMLLHGLSMFDLPDHNWRDLYDDGVSPEDSWGDAVEGGILE